jgi:hypothetical protein
MLRRCLFFGLGVLAFVWQLGGAGQLHAQHTGGMHPMFSPGMHPMFSPGMHPMFSQGMHPMFSPGMHGGFTPGSGTTPMSRFDSRFHGGMSDPRFGANRFRFNDGFEDRFRFHDGSENRFRFDERFRGGMFEPR